MNAITLQEIDPLTVKSWLDSGKARLVDVREPDEFRHEHIPGAVCVPASELTSGHADQANGTITVLQCNSGARSCVAAEAALSAGAEKAYHLEGGLQAWKSAGLAVERDQSAPLPIMRQVQIIVGSLVVLGVVLAYFVAPAFALLSAFAGAGLAVAGVTGFCGMAKLLAFMPWNRRTMPDAQTAT